MPSDKRERVPVKKSHGGGGSKSHHHKASDSGVAQDFEEQRYSAPALREALENALAENEQWKAKFRMADSEVAKAHKKLREVEGQWRAVIERNEVLEEDKNQMFREKKNLQGEVEALRTEILRLRRSPPREVPPSRMPGPLGGEPQMMKPPSPPAPPVAAPKLMRRESKRNKDDKEKARLSQRFEMKDDKSVSSTESSRRRRDSYVEPFGPGGRPPSVIQTPQPPPQRVTRSFSNYAASQTKAPVFSSMNQPQFSNIPRSSYAVGQEQLQYGDVFYDDGEYEDGNYHAHPLPEVRKTRR